jgi:hypothetical protein
MWYNCITAATLISANLSFVIAGFAALLRLLTAPNVHSQNRTKLLFLHIVMKVVLFYTQNRSESSTFYTKNRSESCTFFASFYSLSVDLEMIVKAYLFFFL